MSSEIEELAPQAQHPNVRILPNDLPEVESLRHIIRTRFTNGMSEDFMGIILREILLGLRHLHVKMQYGYENTNARDIFVSTDDRGGIAIGLAYVQGRHLVQPGNPWERGRSQTDGLWGLGIIALELAYGSLPRDCIGTEQLVAMANNLLEILKLKLSDDDWKGKEKGKKTERDKKGKEKDKKNEEESKKLMVKLPGLEKLLDDGYVDSLVKKLLKEKKDQEKKNTMVFLRTAFKKAKNFLKKKGDDGERKFSSVFLDLVMRLLDKRRHTAEVLIMAHPFLHSRKPTVRAIFERRMRGEA